MAGRGLFVEPQVFVHGVGWMDTIVERCVNIELDGKTHTTPESRAKDYARDAKALARGFGTLRLTYADVVHHSDQTLATTRACVARRLALGGLPTY